MSCFHCHASYDPDENDPSFWMQCDTCPHVVHVECDQRCSLSTRLDTGPEFVRVKMENDLANGVNRAHGAHGCGAKSGENWRSESGSFAASGSTDRPSPLSMNPQVSTELRRQSSETVAGGAGKIERMYSDAEVRFDWKGANSQESEVVAAAAAAARARRAAVAARANFVAKAAVADKAAAVARAALEAAAFAARAAAQARAELRKASSSELPRGIGQHLEDDRSASTSILAVPSASAQELEEQDGPKIVDRGVVMDMHPGVAPLAEVAPSATDILEVPSGVLTDGQWPFNDIVHGLEGDPFQNDFGKLMEDWPDDWDFV